MSSRRRRDPAVVSCTQGKQVHALVWEAAAPVDRSRGLAPRSGKEELLRQRLVVLIVCCLLWRGVVNDCARQHLERRHGRASHVITIRCQRSGAESDERSDVPASAGKRRWGHSKLRVALVACAASCVDPVPTRWQRCVSALAPCCDAVTGLGGWRVVLIKLRTRVVWQWEEEQRCRVDLEASMQALRSEYSAAKAQWQAEREQLLQHTARLVDEQLTARKTVEFSTLELTQELEDTKGQSRTHCVPSATQPLIAHSLPPRDLRTHLPAGHSDC